jgi:hypothetical protein
MPDDQLPFQLDSPATVAVARSTDPDTSHEAAQRLTASGMLTAAQEAVLALFRAYISLTDVELVEKYEWERVAQSDPRTPDRMGRAFPPQSDSGLRTRRHELVVAGKLRKAGKKKHDGDNYHTVWSLA